MLPRFYCIKLGNAGTFHAGKITYMLDGNAFDLRKTAALTHSSRGSTEIKMVHVSFP